MNTKLVALTLATTLASCWIPYAEKGADNIRKATENQHAHCSYGNLVPCPPPAEPGGYCCSVCGGECAISGGDAK